MVNLKIILLTAVRNTTVMTRILWSQKADEYELLVADHMLDGTSCQLRAVIFYIRLSRFSSKDKILLYLILVPAWVFFPVEMFGKTSPNVTIFVARFLQ